MVLIDTPLMWILMSSLKILGLFVTLTDKTHTHAAHFWKLPSSSRLGLFRPHLPWKKGGKGGSSIVQQIYL